MANGANLYSGGVYGHKPWDKDRAGVITPEQAAFPPQSYIGPFASNQERLLSQSLAALTMSAAEIQQYVRPPLPQIKLFPPRYGFTENEIGIEDIIDLPRTAPTAQRVESDFSNTPNTTQSSSRNTLGGSV
jgi:hypothetical protein